MLDSLHQNVRGLLKDRCWDLLSHWLNGSPGTEPRYLYASQGPHLILIDAQRKNHPSKGFRVQSILRAVEVFYLWVAINFCRGNLQLHRWTISLIYKCFNVKTSFFIWVAITTMSCLSCFVIKMLRRVRGFITQSKWMLFLNNNMNSPS